MPQSNSSGGARVLSENKKKQLRNISRGLALARNCTLQPQMRRHARRGSFIDCLAISRFDAKWKCRSLSYPLASVLVKELQPCVALVHVGVGTLTEFVGWATEDTRCTGCKLGFVLPGRLPRSDFGECCPNCESSFFPLKDAFQPISTMCKVGPRKKEAGITEPVIRETDGEALVHPVRFANLRSRLADAALYHSRSAYYSGVRGYERAE